MLELCLVVWYYFHQKPSDWQNYLLHALPMFLFPFTSYQLKRLISFFYNRRIVNTGILPFHFFTSSVCLTMHALLLPESDLQELVERQKQEIENLKKITKFMETKNLLDRYEPRITPKKPTPPAPRGTARPTPVTRGRGRGGGRGAPPPTPYPSPAPFAAPPRLPAGEMLPPQTPASTPQTPNVPQSGLRQRPGKGDSHNDRPYVDTPIPTVMMPVPRNRPPMPTPVLPVRPQQPPVKRSLFDSVVDWLIGEDPEAVQQPSQPSPLALYRQDQRQQQQNAQAAMQRHADAATGDLQRQPQDEEEEEEREGEREPSTKQIAKQEEGSPAEENEEEVVSEEVETQVVEADEH
ncbi:Leucine-rich repeat extensin-like protein 3, variant 2 [Balamuthia mandrillaris]